MPFNLVHISAISRLTHHKEDQEEAALDEDLEVIPEEMGKLIAAEGVVATPSGPSEATTYFQARVPLCPRNPLICESDRGSFSGCRCLPQTEIWQPAKWGVNVVFSKLALWL